MTTHTSSKPNRQQRRKDAARSRKKAIRDVRANWANLDAELLEVVGDRAFEVVRAAVAELLGVRVCDLDRCYINVDDTMGRSKLVPATTVGAVHIPFVAQRLLRAHGLESRVVAGYAIWSVGPGDLDTVDHGIRHRYGSERDVTDGNYHTWLEVQGHLCDFGARFLPYKLEAAHAMQPFTTPRRHWRRFPKTIVHPAGTPMGNPVTDRLSAYKYVEGPPSLFQIIANSPGHRFASAVA